MISASSGYVAKDFTFANILAEKARRNGDKTFLTYLPDGRHYSYVDIDRLSNRVANGFLAAGINKGVHVAMLMENSPEQVLAYFALGKIGAVVVPINTAARGRFLEYYLNNSESTALILDESLLSNVLALEDRSGVKTVFVLAERGAADLPSLDAHADFRDFRSLENGAETPPGVEVLFSDMAAIMYTSGTTGPSKGNVFTQIHSLSFGLGFVPLVEFSSEDTYYLALPLFHSAAFNAGLLVMLMVDGSAALARRFSVSNYWRDIQASGATVGMMLAMGHFLLKQPPSPMDRANRLRVMVTSPMLPNAREFEERFGPRLVQGYGLTDYCCATCQPMNAPESKRMSMGIALEGVDVRLVDGDDHEVPVGEVGEITLRKNDMPFATAQGYYKMPEATLAAWRNLWFHTGDRARRDDDGYYYFVDRTKDALRRRGENISTHEVESAILRHPGVADVAVYPVQVMAGDDEVGASIVLRDDCGNVDERVLYAHCQDNMPHYMVPRFIDIRKSLPRTLTNKLRKQEMRDHIEANLATVWDCEQEGLGARRRPLLASQIKA